MNHGEPITTNSAVDSVEIIIPLSIINTMKIIIPKKNYKFCEYGNFIKTIGPMKMISSVNFYENYKICENKKFCKKIINYMKII